MFYLYKICANERLWLKQTIRFFFFCPFLFLNKKKVFFSKSLGSAALHLVKLSKVLCRITDKGQNDRHSHSRVKLYSPLHCSAMRGRVPRCGRKSALLWFHNIDKFLYPVLDQVPAFRLHQEHLSMLYKCVYLLANVWFAHRGLLANVATQTLCNVTVRTPIVFALF